MMYATHLAQCPGIHLGVQNAIAFIIVVTSFLFQHYTECTQMRSHNSGKKEVETMMTLESFLYTCESGTDVVWEARRALWRGQRLRGQVGIFQAGKGGDISDRRGRRQCGLCRIQPTV